MILDPNNEVDVKPDNILVNWTCDKAEVITAADTTAADTTVTETGATVTDVAHGDFDIAFKLQPGETRQTPYAIGNAMWRSPEGQTGRGVTKASDIFSFGLVASRPLNIFKNYADPDTVYICSWRGGPVVAECQSIPGLVKGWHLTGARHPGSTLCVFWARF
jgi:serine/threonine protein kinase